MPKANVANTRDVLKHPKKQNPAEARLNGTANNVTAEGDILALTKGVARPFCMGLTTSLSRLSTLS